MKMIVKIQIGIQIKNPIIDLMLAKEINIFKALGNRIQTVGLNSVLFYQYFVYTLTPNCCRVLKTRPKIVAQKCLDKILNIYFET